MNDSNTTHFYKQHLNEQKTLQQNTGKYLTFYLENEEYAVEILKVQEIIGMMPTTHMPGLSDFIKGFINLRGRIIPVIDMRKKFGMESIEDTNETCIIVIQTGGLLMGIIVDKVSEVLDIKDENIEDIPALGANLRTDYFKGIAKSNDNIKLIFDLDTLLTSDEVLNMESVMISTKSEAVNESVN